MSKSLGIYIENNLIKYAKVSKEHEEVKIEAYGVRATEDVKSEIKKVIEETFSFNIPISINLAEEKYIYFDIFALLNKKDIQKTVETEFESYCEEKQYNQNAFETRYALVENIDDKEKIKAIDIAVNKIELNKQLEDFEQYRISSIVPLPMTIADVAKIDKKENTLIINMEETTTFTTVIDQKIYDVTTLEMGSREILEQINKIENSYSRAYEICKNTTIYTADMDGLSDTQSHLQYVLPTVYNIREELAKMLENTTIKYDKIYLTGTLALVNNIDLYFQEVLKDVECKILKPRFISDTTHVNMKEYVEVNSAIALAVSDLGEGIQTLNFKKTNIGEKLVRMLNIDTEKALKGKANIKINFNFGEKLNKTEIWLVRGILSLLIVMAIFIIFSKVLTTQMKEKEKEIDGLIVSQTSEITKVGEEKTQLENKTTKYTALIERLEKVNDKMSDIAARKNAIPNLLNQIMYIIPEQVQLTSIDNTIDKQIEIKAQSLEYRYLGMFISGIKTKNILTNAVASSGVKNGDIVSITIKGELP